MPMNILTTKEAFNFFETSKFHFMKTLIAEMLKVNIHVVLEVKNKFLI